MIREKIVLKKIHTEREWQCAYDAIEHAETDKRVLLSYETPDGDIQLEVKPVGVHQWTVTKK